MTLLRVHVTPNAKDALVIEAGQDALEVRVDERAIDGKANKRLQEILAAHFGVRKTHVRIVRGARSRDKIVEVIV